MGEMAPSRVERKRDVAIVAASMEKEPGNLHGTCRAGGYRVPRKTGEVP